MLHEVLAHLGAGLVVGLPFVLGATAAEPGPTPAGDAQPELRFADPEIVEASGLVVVDGRFVTVNDSGDEGRVFTVDPGTGETVGVTSWSDPPTDAEALAPGPAGTVWVGDIGDNTASRDVVEVLEIPVGPGERTVEPPTYRLHYPNGSTDAEALLADPGTGRLYVVTKSVFGGLVYAAPRLVADRVNQLRRVGRVMPVVTDGAILPDGRRLVLRDYDRAVVYRWPSLALLDELALPEQRQGEALAADPGGRTVHVTSEGQRAPVFEVPLPREGETGSPAPSGSPTPFSREGSELPEKPSEGRDPTQWLLGTGLVVLALLVLWRAVRPRPGDPPR